MRLLNPTPRTRLLDRQERPYFLWDEDLTLPEYLFRLREGPPEDRGYWLAKLMRQAKPDDVFEFVSVSEIEALWTHTAPYLGTSAPFWRWILGVWDIRVDA